MIGSGALFVLQALFIIQFAMATPKDEYTAINDGLQAIENVSEKLRHEINNQVNIQELQHVIDDIDRSMLGYQGTAKRHLDELRRLNSIARLKFMDVKGSLLEWCVSSNSTLPLTIESITNPIIGEEERNIVWKSTMMSIASGVKKTKESIASFEETKEIRSQLDELLEGMKKDVKFDFSPDGYYATKMTTGSASSIPSIVTYLFIILSSLQCAWARATNSNRVEREARINGFDKADLLMKIEKAESIATIDADLSDAKASLESLGQMISQADKSQRVLLADSPALQADLLETFKSIGHECYQYVKEQKA